MIDVVIIQEHKLRKNSLRGLDNKLMDGYKSLFLKAASGEKSWVHPNITDKGKWKFYYSVNALVRLVLIRLEWIEGGKIG